MSTTVCVST